MNSLSAGISSLSQGWPTQTEMLTEAESTLCVRAQSSVERQWNHVAQNELMKNKDMCFYLPSNLVCQLIICLGKRDLAQFCHPSVEREDPESEKYFVERLRSSRRRSDNFKGKNADIWSKNKQEVSYGSFHLEHAPESCLCSCHWGHWFSVLVAC